MGKGDIKVLSDLLGEKEFMFGDEPSLLDLIVFSHLAPVSNPFITRVLVVDNPPPLKNYPISIRIGFFCPALFSEFGKLKDIIG